MTDAETIKALRARVAALEAALDEAIDAIQTEVWVEGDGAYNDDQALAVRDRCRAVLDGLPSP